jgi:methionyl-tRNA formyltransferase
VYPYPLPRIKYQNKTYELLKVDLVEKSYYMTNGRVVNIDSDGVWVKIEDGLLVIKELIDVETDKKILSSDIFKIGVRLK